MPEPVQSDTESRPEEHGSRVGMYLNAFQRRKWLIYGITSILSIP